HPHRGDQSRRNARTRHRSSHGGSNRGRIRMIDSLRNQSIAVLMGGPGAEREVSLRSGAAVANALRSVGAVVAEIDVRDETFEVPAGTLIAVNMIHGTFGEDGQLQSILD